MTDETREQINRDSIKYGADHYGILEKDFDTDDAIYHSHVDGATHQHSISFEQGRKVGYRVAAKIASDSFETILRATESIKEDLVIKDLRNISMKALESLRNERA